MSKLKPVEMVCAPCTHSMLVVASSWFWAKPAFAKLPLGPNVTPLRMLLSHVKQMMAGKRVKLNRLMFTSPGVSGWSVVAKVCMRANPNFWFQVSVGVRVVVLSSDATWLPAWFVCVNPSRLLAAKGLVDGLFE